MPEPVDRASVLGYRAAVHDLEVPAPERVRCAVLGTGVQDTPPGRTARLALAARTAGTVDPGDPGEDADLVLVHSLRATMHLHRAADLGLLAAALRPDSGGDLLPASQGTYAAELEAAGIALGAALDRVAAVMVEVTAGGEAVTKGQLSGLTSSALPDRLRPWCQGCGVRHVHDGLFRMATLAAGLALRPVGDGSALFHPVSAGWEAAPTEGSRRELLRRFLRHCGPSTPAVFGAWLGWAPPAARRWWDLLAADLVAVSVDARRGWMHPEDLPALRRSGPSHATRLLPPYDPLVEVADRALLLPDPGRRRQVWRATANPGTVLADGELVGTWRQRHGLVTVTPWERPPRGRLAAIRSASERVPGITSVQVSRGP